MYSLLANLTIKSKFCFIREVALPFVTDERKLEKIAQFDSNRSIREVAIRRLKNQSLLASIAINDNYAYCAVGQAAIEQMTDDEYLFLVAQKAKDRNIRSSATAKITDPTKLAQIACQGQCSYAVEQVTAVLHIDAPELLISIVMNENANAEARAEAIKRIPEKKLQEVITDIEDDYICSKVIERISNQEVLENIISRDYGFLAKCAAVERIESTEKLLEVINNCDESGIVRRHAVLQIEDQSTLLNLARSHSCEYVRTGAIEALNDGKLAVSFIDDKSEYVRSAIVEAISDQKMLEKIALFDTSNAVQVSAINKLSDQDLLYRIAAEGDNSSEFLDDNPHYAALLKLDYVHRRKYDEMEHKKIMHEIFE